MKTHNFQPKKLALLDLLIVPILVLLCFYAVVYQVEQPSKRDASDSQERKIVSISLGSSKDDVNLRSHNIPMSPVHAFVARGKGMYFPAFSRPKVNSFVGDYRKETYQKIASNSINLVVDKSVSTFSVDVDTGGFANIRRILNSGNLPEFDQVRTEELINYFSYNYLKPNSLDEPFSITTDIIESPWNSQSHILQIGIKGFEQKSEDLPNSNIVFLVDISGSMNHPNKLTLVKKSLRLLTKSLKKEDRISLVTYAGTTNVVLSSTRGSNKRAIYSAIELLGAAGSTSGESGLKLAYLEAEDAFIEGGNNRIIMMTDGDFNVGLSSVNEMIRLVETKRKTGVYLSTVGFGMGNYREDMLEQIADHGNGAYFYIDNYKEALRVFEKNIRANIFTIATDVKIQVEFNPNKVSEYRLIGYENRELNNEDFNNDKVDAGDVGQGHSVTALYEITLVGSQGKIDAKRYASNNNVPIHTGNYKKNELAYVKLRYKPVNSEKSVLISKSITLDTDRSSTTLDFRRAIVAASFGELLRESKYIDKSFDYAHLLKLIESLGDKTSVDIYELNDMVLIAKSLTQ